MTDKAHHIIPDFRIPLIGKCTFGFRNVDDIFADISQAQGLVGVICRNQIEETATNQYKAHYKARVPASC